MSNTTQYKYAYSPAESSRPSHLSIWTGIDYCEMDPQHFERKTGNYPTLKKDVSIWHELQNKGYTTGLFGKNPNIISNFMGLQHGFSKCVTSSGKNFPFEGAATDFEGVSMKSLRKCVLSSSPIKSFLNGLWLYRRSTANPVVRANDFIREFIDWESEISGPWAACMNLMDAHLPYLPPKEHNLWASEKTKNWHKERFHDNDFGLQSYENYNSWDHIYAMEALYDGAIHYLDSQLRVLINRLEKKGILDDTLVVISADHGEALGDPSSLITGYRHVGHRGGLEETKVRVPLIVSWPDTIVEDIVDRKINSQPRTLTGFRETALDVLEGKLTTPFMPKKDHRVIVSDRAGANMIQTHPEAPDRPEDFAYAVYEKTTGKGVLKHYLWGDYYQTFRIINDNFLPVEGDTKEEIQEELSKRSEINKRYDLFEENSGSIDEQTKEHLEKLGYR